MRAFIMPLLALGVSAATTVGFMNLHAGALAAYYGYFEPYRYLQDGERIVWQENPSPRGDEWDNYLVLRQHMFLVGTDMEARVRIETSSRRINSYDKLWVPRKQGGRPMTSESMDAYVRSKGYNPDTTILLRRVMETNMAKLAQNLDVDIAIPGSLTQRMEFVVRSADSGKSSVDESFLQGAANSHERDVLGTNRDGSVTNYHNYYA